MTQVDARRTELAAAFRRRRGNWSQWHEQLLALSPEFFAAYTDLTSVPWESGVLSPKVKEFIYIAIDVSATHLYERGTHVHMANAIRHGATPEELVELLHVVSLIGAHTLEVGVPILEEELRKQGHALPPSAPQLQEAHERYAALRGAASSLEPRIAEFIGLAVCAATTHLYEPGIRLHARRAIELGASSAELMEVLQLASALGMHTCSIGVPILSEELSRVAASKTDTHKGDKAC